MPEPIKVLPTADEFIGIAHPVDGPIAAEGSFWSFDHFTMSRLLDGTIRRDEVEIQGEPAKAPKATKPQAPATSAT